MLPTASGSLFPPQRSWSAPSDPCFSAVYQSLCGVGLRPAERFERGELHSIHGLDRGWSVEPAARQACPTARNLLPSGRAYTPVVVEGGRGAGPAAELTYLRHGLNPF